MEDGLTAALTAGASDGKRPTGNIDDDEGLTQLRTWFEDAEEATQQARKNSERDRDY